MLHGPWLLVLVASPYPLLNGGAGLLGGMLGSPKFVW